MLTPLPPEELFMPGHTACAGCGEAIAVRTAMKALGEDTIVCISGGCIHFSSARSDSSSWSVPAIHVLPHNAHAVASGIEVAMRRLGRKTNVVVFAGDGETFDTGLELFLEVLERKHKIVCICLDNEGYMSTGVQKSGLTPPGALTKTTPAGNQCLKEDTISLISKHVKYIATATVAHPRDIFNKVKNAAERNGPSFVHILTPCPTGWGFKSSKTAEISRLALETCLWVNFEIVDGEVRNVLEVNRKPVTDYLRMQGRFQHLFRSDEGRKVIEKIQKVADENAKKFGL